MRCELWALKVIYGRVFCANMSLRTVESGSRSEIDHLNSGSGVRRVEGGIVGVE